MASIPPNAALSAVVRTCRYGHGNLQMVDGWFSLTGAKAGAALPGKVLPQEALFNADPWRIFALRVWRCDTCGYVELADEEP